MLLHIPPEILTVIMNFLFPIFNFPIDFQNDLKAQQILNLLFPHHRSQYNKLVYCIYRSTINEIVSNSGVSIPLVDCSSISQWAYRNTSGYSTHVDWLGLFDDVVEEVDPECKTLDQQISSQQKNVILNISSIVSLKYVNRYFYESITSSPFETVWKNAFGLLFDSTNSQHLQRKLIPIVKTNKPLHLCFEKQLFQYNVLEFSKQFNACLMQYNTTLIDSLIEEIQQQRKSHLIFTKVLQKMHTFYSSQSIVMAMPYLLRNQKFYQMIICSDPFTNVKALLRLWLHTKFAIRDIHDWLEKYFSSHVSLRTLWEDLLLKDNYLQTLFRNTPPYTVSVLELLVNTCQYQFTYTHSEPVHFIEELITKESRTVDPNLESLLRISLRLISNLKQIEEKVIIRALTWFSFKTVPVETVLNYVTVLIKFDFSVEAVFHGKTCMHLIIVNPLLFEAIYLLSNQEKLDWILQLKKQLVQMDDKGLTPLDDLLWHNVKNLEKETVAYNYSFAICKRLDRIYKWCRRAPVFKAEPWKISTLTEWKNTVLVRLQEKYAKVLLNHLEKFEKE